MMHRQHMTSPRRLSTAILGTGRIAPAHVDAVRATGLADVVAIGGSDPERSRRMAADQGVPRAATPAELVEDPSVDVVHIAGTNDVHAQTALRAIAAGKHVVVEKPLALTTSEADAIVEAAELQGVMGMTLFTYWGFAPVQQMRTRIRAGAIGRPHLVHGAYLQDWLAAPTDHDWRCDPLLGGRSRALADIGTHWFSLVEFVTDASIESVVADFGRLFDRRGGAGGSEAVEVINEDTASVLLRLSNGAHGALVVSQVSHGHDNHVRVEISGSDGTLAWDIERGSELQERLLAAASQGSGARPESAAPARSALSREHELTIAVNALVDAFYRDLAGVRAREGVTYPALVDGARAVAITDAALRSHESGTWERVEAHARRAGPGAR